MERMELEIKTEERDTAGLEPGETRQGSLPEKPCVKEEPDEGSATNWDAQLQDFLRTLQAPQCSGEPTPLPGPHSSPGAREMATQTAAVATKWPKGLWVSSDMVSFVGEAKRDPEKPLDANDEEEEEGKGKEEGALEGDPVWPEVQRQRFRSLGYREADGPRELCRQLQEHCRQWLKPERRTKEQMVELVTLEQFLAILPLEMQGWVRKEAPKTCAQAVSLAEEFLLSQQKARGCEQKITGVLKETSVDLLASDQAVPDTVEARFSLKAAPLGAEHRNIFGNERAGQRKKWKSLFDSPKKTEGPSIPSPKASATPLPQTPTTPMPRVPATPSPRAPATPSPKAPATPLPRAPATPSPRAPATHSPKAPAAPMPKAPATPSPRAPATPSPQTPATLSPKAPATPLPKAPATPSPRAPATPPPQAPATPLPRAPATPSPRAPATPLPRAPETPSPRAPETPSPRAPETPSPRAPETPLPRVPETPLPRAPETPPPRASETPPPRAPAPAILEEEREAIRDKRKEKLDPVVSLVTPENAKAEKTSYKCWNCSQSFGCSAALLAHERTHVGEKMYKCSRCGETEQFCKEQAFCICSRCGNDLDAPCQGEREKCYTCAECGKVYTRRLPFLQHQRTHQVANGYACLDCGKAYRLKKEFLQHQRTHEARYVCLDCGKAYSRKGEFLQHQKTHQAVKSYTCLDCGEVYNRKVKFLQHQRAHQAASKYICCECGEVCQEKWFLEHQKAHKRRRLSLRCFADQRTAHEPAEEETYPCLVCDEAFRTEELLQAHERSHVPQTHKCSYCGECYQHESSLKSHYELNHKTVWSCCGENFHQLSDFLLHELKHGKK